MSHQRDGSNSVDGSAVLPGDGGSTPDVSGSFTTLSFIPGENENGSPLKSSIMHIIPDSDYLPGQPIYDAWFVGDGVESMPSDLSTALSLRKNLEESADPLRRYRHKDQITVSFDTSNGQEIDEESLQITFNDGSPATTPPNNVNFRNEELPYTVLEQEDINTLNDKIDSWFDGHRQHRSVRMPRYWATETVQASDGTAGIRVSSVSGSYDWYAEVLAEKAADLSTKAFLEGILGFPISDLTYELIGERLSFIYDLLIITPKVFTFLDFIVLADGRRVGRFWDGSLFPRHTAYLDGSKKQATDFDKGDEWQPKEVLNKYQIGWMLEAQSSALTPYETSQWLYLQYLKGEANLSVDIDVPFFDIDLLEIQPDHPLMT